MRGVVVVRECLDCRDNGPARSKGGSSRGSGTSNGRSSGSASVTVVASAGGGSRRHRGR